MNPALSRDDVLADIVERNRVWPLIDSLSCHNCATPRPEQYDRGFDTCFQCKRLRERYYPALADLFPITYTTPDWALGAAMRRFKDSMGCRIDAGPALGFGAVLSAYLEEQIDRIAPSGGFDMVATIPSSNPTMAQSLARAANEGWWVPDLTTDYARIRRGFPRQRERPRHERGEMDGKWIVDADFVAGSDILVIDDIMTTGNSIYSFAHALRQAGARSIRAVILARNVGKGDGEWIRPLLDAAAANGDPWTPGVNKRDVIR